MSNNGEDIIRETFKKLGDAIGVQMQMPDTMIKSLGVALQAQIDLLTELQSAGRLIPAGGMALTAEDVRKFIIAIERHYPEGEAELLARLRALFPATEPAEPCSRGVCSANNGHEGTCAEASGWAEPAEEETKAERHCCHPKCRFTDWGGINRKHERGADCPIVPKPASSPVVPAPTETGPWQRIEDVPETVGRLTDRDGDIWEWDGDNWVTPETAILPTAYINKHFAPFVAAAKEG